MFEVIFLSALALIWIVFATVQDIRKREIANWLNFSLIIFALGFRFFYSLFSDFGFSFFYQGLIGFGIFLVLGNLLYYGRMFAGGDAKLMIALGAILPFTLVFNDNLRIFALFFILFLLIIFKASSTKISVSGRGIKTFLLRIKSNRLVGEDLEEFDRIIAGEPEEDFFDEDILANKTEEEIQQLIPRMPQPRK